MFRPVVRHGHSAEDPRARAFLVPVAVLCVLLLAGLTASGNPAAGALPAHDEPGALDLLRRAADAELRTGYEGVQLVSFFNGSTTDSTMVDVEHHPGHGTAVSGGGPEDNGGGLVMSPGRSRLDFDQVLLRLLQRNYAVVRGGAAGTICGRDTSLVEARRSDGSTAGRFWVDDSTGLLMRRETVDSAGRVAQSSGFVSIDLGEDGGTPPYAGKRQAEPWGDRLDAAELRELNGEQWRLPARLATRFDLVEARARGAGNARSVHLAYSDGLSLLSVFVQRGRLGTKATDAGTADGMRRVVEGGAVVYVGDDGQHRRMWESDGFVYTIMADAPAEAVSMAARTLPAPDGTGFWSRVGRGFDRLGSWIGL